MDGIITGVRSKDVEHSCIVVTNGSDVELLCPSFLMVHACEIEQDCAAELEHFLPCRLLSGEGVAEDLVDFLKLKVLCIECVQAMVQNAKVGRRYSGLKLRLQGRTS